MASESAHSNLLKGLPDSVLPLGLPSADYKVRLGALFTIGKLVLFWLGTFLTTGGLAGIVESVSTSWRWSSSLPNLIFGSAYGAGGLWLLLHLVRGLRERLLVYPTGIGHYSRGRVHFYAWDEIEDLKQEAADLRCAAGTCLAVGYVITLFGGGGRRFRLDTRFQGLDVMGLADVIIEKVNAARQGRQDTNCVDRLTDQVRLLGEPASTYEKSAMPLGCLPGAFLIGIGSLLLCVLVQLVVPMTFTRITAPPQPTGSAEITVSGSRPSAWQQHALCQLWLLLQLLSLGVLMVWGGLSIIVFCRDRRDRLFVCPSGVCYFGQGSLSLFVWDQIEDVKQEEQPYSHSDGWGGPSCEGIHYFCTVRNRAGERLVLDQQFRGLDVYGMGQFIKGKVQEARHTENDPALVEVRKELIDEGVFPP